LKILFLTHFFPPEMGAAASRMHGLARWLDEWGHDITILTGFPNYPTGIIPEKYKMRFIVNDKIESVNVIRTWVYATSHQSSVKRIINYFSFVFSAIITGIIIRKRYDIIFVSSPPLFIGIAGYILSKLNKVPFVFDLRDLWPDVAVETGTFSEKSIFIKWSRRLADWLYKSATHLTPVTDSKYERLKSNNINADKLTVVTNGVDLDRQNINLDENWRKKLDISKKFIITYTGLIGVAQGIEIAVDAANLLRKNSSVHFVIVGEGVDRKKLIDKANKLKLSNITFVPRQPRESIPSLIASSDIALVPLVSGALKDAVPSKLFEAWAFQKAVILAAEGESAEIVQKSGGGLVISPGNHHELAKAVTSLYQDQEQLSKYAEAGYKFVNEQYDRKQAAQILENVFKKIILKRV